MKRIVLAGPLTIEANLTPLGTARDRNLCPVAVDYYPLPALAAPYIWREDFIRYLAIGLRPPAINGSTICEGIAGVQYIRCVACTKSWSAA
jgi:hypothetical protein